MINIADITTKSTSIQCNPLDVATELTQLHLNIFGARGKDDIAEQFAKYYSLTLPH